MTLRPTGRSLLALVAICLLARNAPGVVLAAWHGQGTGRISGKVSTTDGKGLASANVTITSTRLTRSTTTNDSGNFDFRGLPPSAYLLTASKNGFVATDFGAFRPGGLGTPIALADGAELADIDVLVTASATLAGRIVDNEGEGLGGISVAVSRQGPNPVVVGTVTTDAHGRYSFPGLAAGRYQVCGIPSSIAGPNLRLTATCFPGTRPVDAAVGVQILPGERRGDIDFVIQRTITGSVKWQVISPTGLPLSGLNVRLLAEGPSLIASWLGGRLTVVDNDAKVEGLALGEYRLVVSASSGSVKLWGATDFVILGSEPQNLSLTVEPTPLIQGSIASADRDGFGNSKLFVRLLPVPGKAVPLRLGGSWSAGTESVLLSTVASDGRFEFRSVDPGTYKIEVDSATERGLWSLAQARTAEIELGDALTVEPGRDVNVQLGITKARATVRGRLQTIDGLPATAYHLVAFPQDRGLWLYKAERFAIVRPATDGTFEISRLLGGEYEIGIVGDLDDQDWLSSAYLEQLSAGSVKLKLSTEKTANLVLTVPRSR